MKKSTTRPAILMAILLLMVLAYVSRPYWGYLIHVASQPAPLPGRNEVSGLEAQRDANGVWTVSFDYYFNGAPVGSAASLIVQPIPDHPNEKNNVSQWRQSIPGIAMRGKHHVSAELWHPGDGARSTKRIQVQLWSGKEVLASQVIDRRIEWPDAGDWHRDRQLATQSPDVLLKQAVALIDSGERRELAEAKSMLERLIERDAKFDAGYVELARVAMKSNWGPEGLHQAENLLASALQINPGSTNAKILLGYVFTHQQRYPQAEKLFAEAAQTDTRNLWLWANWGELLASQGKWEPAIQKYREAVTRARTHDTYDQARLDAYGHLLILLEQRKDLEGMQALYKQRTDEFGSEGCHGAAYARFMLLQRGDLPTALDIANQALKSNCNEAREVLGMVHYMNWANSSGSQGLEALNKARVFLPAGPLPLYLLSSSDRTLPTAKALIAHGEKIDQLDNNKLNALAYALERKDIDAVKRLLRLGASPNALVGEEQMPVALVPVMTGDLDAIRVMQRSGADYAKLQFRGVTAIDMARRTDNKALLGVLKAHAETL